MAFLILEISIPPVGAPSPTFDLSKIQDGVSEHPVVKIIREATIMQRPQFL